MQAADIDSDGVDELLVATDSTDDYCVNLSGRVDLRDYFIESCNDNLHYHNHRNSESTSEFLELDLSALDMRRFNWSILDFTSDEFITTPQRIIDNVVSAPVGRASIYGGNVFKPLELTDFNNDGYLDFSFSTFKNISLARGNVTVSGITFEHAGMQGYLRSPGVNGFFVKASQVVSSNVIPETLNNVSNGVGMDSNWHYANLSTPLNRNQRQLYDTPSNRSERYLTGEISKEYMYFTSSMPVISSFSESNGLNGKTLKEYFYREAVYNRQGRGFMGFKSIIEEDVTKGIVTQSDFEQVFPYQGKLTRQATFASDDFGAYDLLGSAATEVDALSFKEIEWQDNSNHSVAGVYSVYPKTTKIVTRLPSTSESSSNSYSKTNVSTHTVTVNSVDKYGNVKEKVTQITDSWGVNKTTEAMSYDYDESTWFIDKLTAKTVTKHALTNRNSQDPITTTTELDPTTKVVTDLTNYHANRKPRNITVSGLRGTSTSGKGATTVTTYNDYGLPTQVSATAQVRNSSGSWVNQTRTTKTAYSKDGNTIAVDGYFPYELKNAKNHLSYTHVNPATGKVTKTRQQLSGSSYLTTVYTYDDYSRPFSSKTDGQPIVYTAVQFPDAQAPTNAVLQVVSVSAGQPTQKVYQDKLGRVLRTAVEDFNGDWVFTDVEYNDLGYKIFESIPYKEGSTAYGVSYTGYDILGRLTEKVTNQHCGDMTTTYAYVGLKTDITASEDCEGKAIDMSRTYNTLKQLMETVDANNGVTRYSYNAQGLPVVIQDANSNKIIAKYNALGRKTHVNDPNQGVTNFEYNGFGELQKEARVDSKTLTFITDVLGRVTRRTATGENTLNYTYDGASYGLGQLNQATGNGVTKSFSFDSLGRPATQTLTGSGKTYKTTTFYDANYGRVKGLRYPNNLTLSYDYTSSGYLQSVKNTASGYIYKTVTDRDVFGNITAADLGNGTSETSTFSSRNGQMLLKAVAKGSNSLMNINYQGYDGFGNLTQVDVTTGNVGIDQHQFIETYEYDNLHRLERNLVDGYEVTSYSYDAIGNLLSKSDYASEYDYINGSTGGPNAVKRVYRNGWKSIGYDARGNMTSGDGLTSAIYNAMDKPTQIKKAGKTLDFTYGPQHMRFKQVNGSVTTFYSDKLYEEEVNGSKTTWRAYVDDIAVISQTTNESATIRYTHKDRLGSARLFTDKNGYVTAQRNFDPFGKPRLASGSLMPYGNSKLNDLADAKTRRGFTDHEHLDDVELIHMNGRVYDYNLGRFMSVDPLIMNFEDSQGINPYSYIRNNPLAGTDPSGYCEAATGTRIKSCGDMKVEVKVTMKDGSVKTGTKVVKDVNFKNGADVSSAMSAGAKSALGNLQSVDIGAPSTTAKRTGGVAGGYIDQQSAARNQRLDDYGVDIDIDGDVAELNGTGDQGLTAMISNMYMGKQDMENMLSGKLTQADLYNRAEMYGTVVSFLPMGYGARAAYATYQASKLTSWGLTLSQSKIMIRTSQEVYKGTTRIGHALSKHAGRKPEVWGKLTGSMKNWNNTATDQLRSILRAPGRFNTIESKGLRFMEKRLGDGRGIRLNMDGSFKGFID